MAYVVRDGAVYRQVITALANPKMQELQQYLMKSGSDRALELIEFDPSAFVDWLFRWSNWNDGTVHENLYSTKTQGLFFDGPDGKELLLEWYGSPDLAEVEEEQGQEADELLQEMWEMEDGESLAEFLYEHLDADILEEYNDETEEGSMDDYFVREKWAPSWIFMEAMEDLGETWVLHFADPKNVVKIQHEGFTRGFKYPEMLGKTKWTRGDEKDTGGGYAFGYTLEDYPTEMYYPEGDRRWQTGVILCRADALYVEHKVDHDKEVVFWGPDAKDIVALMPTREEGDDQWMYSVLTCDGEEAVIGRTLDEAVKWVVQNLNRYRDLLVCR